MFPIIWRACLRVNYSCRLFAECCPIFPKLRPAKKINEMLRLTIAASLYLSLPVGVGLYLVAEEFVLVLLGDTWVEAIPIFKWMCLYTMLVGILMFPE